MDVLNMTYDLVTLDCEGIYTGQVHPHVTVLHTTNQMPTIINKVWSQPIVLASHV